MGVAVKIQQKSFKTWQPPLQPLAELADGCICFWWWLWCFQIECFNIEYKINKKGMLTSFIKLSFPFFCVLFGAHNAPKNRRKSRKKKKNNKTHNSHRYYPFGNLSAILIVSLYNTTAYAHVQWCVRCCCVIFKGRNPIRIVLAIHGCSAFQNFSIFVFLEFSFSQNQNT